MGRQGENDHIWAISNCFQTPVTWSSDGSKLAYLSGCKEQEFANIFTIPNADKWTLIINKKTGEWGIPYKYESDELAARRYEGLKNIIPGREFHDFL